jgi:hypothetical protein
MLLEGLISHVQRGKCRRNGSIEQDSHSQLVHLFCRRSVCLRACQWIKYCIDAWSEILAHSVIPRPPHTVHIFGKEAQRERPALETFAAQQEMQICNLTWHRNARFYRSLLRLVNVTGEMSLLPRPLYTSSSVRNNYARLKRHNTHTSNCRAADLDGNPYTMHTTSQGLSESLEVLTAPPVEMPLCCFHLRTMFGVDPT